MDTDTLTMIAKVSDLIGTEYLSHEESAEMERLHLKPTPLTGEEIQWLKTIYHRLYSLK